MVAAAFIPRLNSGSCPTSWKFSDVPGVPPPGPTVTPSGCPVTAPRWGTTPPNAPAAGAMARMVTARHAANDAGTGRRLIARTSLYGTSHHAITGCQPGEGNASVRPRARPDAGGPSTWSPAVLPATRLFRRVAPGAARPLSAG